MAGLKGRHVLVTGAGGFVGSHLCRELAERGAKVSGTGIESAAPGGTFERWHTADLLEPETLDRAVAEAKPDVIVHLAGQASAGRSFQEPEETFRINALGTWHLLEAFRQHVPGARLLVIGSGEAYGPLPEGSRAAEDAPNRPVSPYALSKAAADAMAEAVARKHGLDIVRTRSFSHTGPGQAPRFVMPSWAKQIAEIERDRGEPELKVGNLEVTRDICDVRDVVLAYVALLERGRSGEAYNVCSGEGVKLTQVAEMLVAAARVKVRIEVDPGRVRPADVPYLVGDPAKIEAHTGWRAARALSDTLREVLDGWRAQVAEGP